MMKRKKKMDANTNKLLDFFKVYLPEFSSERMLVPIAYVAKLNKPIPRTTILQRGSGRHWLVEVVKQDDKVYFQEGWREFVRDNDTETGDFLVFSYDGDNKFYVTVLDNSTCEKEFSDVPREVEKRRMTINRGEKEGEDEKEEEKCSNKNGVDNNDFKADVAADDEEHQLNETSDDEDYTDDFDGEDWAEILEEEEEEAGKGSKKNGVDKNDPSADIEADDEEDQLNETNDDEDYINDSDGHDEVELVEEEVMMEQNINEFTDNDEDNADRIGEDSQRSKRKRRCKETKAGESCKSRENKFDSEKHIQTCNPYFVPKLCGRSLRYLHIPINVIKDFKLKLSPKLQFHDPLGRKWDGQVLVWNDGHTYIKGWKVVCRWNNLKEGSHCICELLLEKDSTCNTIKVHIIHRC